MSQQQIQRSKTAQTTSLTAAPYNSNQENRVPNQQPPPQKSSRGAGRKASQSENEGEGGILSGAGILSRTLSQIGRAFGKDILNSQNVPPAQNKYGKQESQPYSLAANFGSTNIQLKPVEEKKEPANCNSLSNGNVVNPFAQRKVALQISTRPGSALSTTVDLCIVPRKVGIPNDHSLKRPQLELESKQRAATAGIQRSNNLRAKPTAIDKAARLREFAAYKEQYYTKPTDEFLPIDQLDAHDPQSVAEFAGEVQKHMQSTEWRNHAQPSCIQTQRDLTSKMRMILISWLVEVHMKFKLLPETLFLTINILDRYTLFKPNIKRGDYQLVAVSAMLIACKYEEIYAPEIRDFIFMTDKAYTKEQMLVTESDILRTLNFNFTQPSSYRFLERYAKLGQCDDLIMNFARFVLELSFMNTTLYKWRPSQIAASAIFIAKKILKRPQPWSPFMIQQTGVDDRMVRACSKDLCLVVNVANSQPEYQSIMRKFSLPRFMEVSKICASVATTHASSQDPNTSSASTSQTTTASTQPKTSNSTPQDDRC